MCWTLNHQNIIEMAQRHIYLSRTVILFWQVRPELGWPSCRADMICQSGAAYAGQWDTRLNPSAPWSLRCDRSKILVEVATLDILSALTRPL
jgi:hypothetical protein